MNYFLKYKKKNLNKYKKKKIFYVLNASYKMKTK